MESKKQRKKKIGLKPNNYSFQADHNSAEISDSDQDDAGYQMECRPGDRARVDSHRATDVNQFEINVVPDPQPTSLILSE